MEINEIKTLKKEKSMFENMKQFLREKEITCELKIVQKHENKEIPHKYNLIGKKFKFIIQIDSELKNENNHPQVILLLNFINNKHVKFHPQTNGQLYFLIKNFIPEEITIEELKENSN